MVDRADRLWVGTERGVSLREGEAWVSLGTKQGRVSDRVLALFEDARGRGCASLDVGVGEGDSRLIDVIPCPRAIPDPPQQELAERLECLPPRLARLVQLRYGIGEPEHTTKQLAAMFGLSLHRVQEELRKALHLLRREHLPPEVLQQLELSIGGNNAPHD